MNPKQTFYEHQANTIIANLKKRQMDGFYCPTCEDAVKKAMELVASSKLRKAKERAEVCRPWTL